MADGYQRPIFKYFNSHNSSAANTVKNTVGILRGISVNTPAAGTITVADTGGNIAVITVTATAPVGLMELDCAFTTLTVTSSVATMDYTVVYQ